MSELWSLPGYDVSCRIGESDLGELWRAREQATGNVVALQRLRDDVDPAVVEQLHAQAPVLRSLETPHLVRWRALVDDGAQPVLVLDHAPGGSLATLLARRGRLEPGEVVTVVAPLASALAVAHSRGVVHGDVSAEQVLFTADGMPLLGGLGLRPGEDAEGGPGEDVRALARLCHRLLAGAAGREASRDDTGAALSAVAPRGLVEAVRRGLEPDPAARPDAAAFATLLRRAHPAAPVRLRGGPAVRPAVRAEARACARPVDVPTAGAAAGRALSGGQLAAVGAVLLVVAGAAGGWAWGRSGGDATSALPPAAALPSEAAPDLPPAAPPSQHAGPSDPTVPLTTGSTPVPPQAPTASADPAAASRSVAAAPPADPSPVWPEVLEELDAARAAALARADASALHAVHAPSSAALAVDTRLVEQLAAAGHRALGVRHAFRAVEVLDEREDQARLRVVDVLAAHELRDATGAVVRRAAARGATASVVELARTPAGWRIVEITAA